jgi:hypothetical protein
LYSLIKNINLGVIETLMKQVLFVFAVSSCLSAAAQHPTNIPGNDLPKNISVNYETLKKFKPVNTSYTASNYNQPASFPRVQPEIQTYNFKPLQQYLSRDIQQYRIQTNKEAWAQFTSGMLISFQQKQWYENKNNMQQRWMAQKVKGKQ